MSVSTSKNAGTTVNNVKVTDHEQDLLLALASGTGITGYDGIGLLEKCDHCGVIFAASGLRAHIRSEVCQTDKKQGTST